MTDDPRSPIPPRESREGALERLAFHLLGMRQGLERYTTGALSALPDVHQRRSQLLDRYDAGLVQAATLLGVEVPGPPDPSTGGRRFTDERRAVLEAALRDAGLELGPP